MVTYIIALTALLLGSCFGLSLTLFNYRKLKACVLYTENASLKIKEFDRPCDADKWAFDFMKTHQDNCDFEIFHTFMGYNRDKFSLLPIEKPGD